MILIIAGCSSVPERPGWIDQPSSAYPESTHLSAVGFADDQQTAGDRALANIAKIFEVTVHESAQDSSSVFYLSDASGQKIENQQSISREINLETKKVLQGAKVVEYWPSQTDRYYALAILAKGPAANGFSQAVHSADKEVNQLVKYASTGANNPLVALSALKKASMIQRQRDEHHRSLMVVNSGLAINSQHNTASIDQLTRDALSTLEIQVTASNEAVQAELQQALAQLGVQIVTQSNLVLKGAVDVAPVSMQQGWYWQRGAYELMFLDGDKVLAKERYPVKVSAREQAMVAQRLKDQLNSNLSQYVFSLMSSKTQ